RTDRRFPVRTAALRFGRAAIPARTCALRDKSKRVLRFGRAAIPARTPVPSSFRLRALRFVGGAVVQRARARQYVLDLDLAVEAEKLCDADRLERERAER